MIGYIALVIFYTIAFLVEARHDAVVSRLVQSSADSMQWHKLDWQYLALVGVGVSIFGANFELGMESLDLMESFMKSLSTGLTIASLKVLIFNVRINKIFGHGWNYLSSTGFESKFKGKENIYYGACLSFFLLSIFYNLYYHGIFNSII